MYVVYEVAVERLKLPSEQVGFNPTWIWPRKNQMVDARTSFSTCTPCDEPRAIELVDISIYRRRPDSLEVVTPVLNTPDVEPLAAGPDQHVFRLRASREPVGVTVGYEVTYRIIDSSGQTRLLGSGVSLPAETSEIRPPPFWAR